RGAGLRSRTGLLAALRRVDRLSDAKHPAASPDAAHGGRVESRGGAAGASKRAPPRHPRQPFTARTGKGLLPADVSHRAGRLERRDPLAAAVAPSAREPPPD